MKASATLLGLLPLLLAGCTEEATLDSPTGDLLTDDLGAQDGPKPEVDLPEPVTLAIGHDGDVGQGIALCEFQVTGGCAVRETKPYAGQLYVEANGTVLGGTLTLTWTSAAPTYDELGLGIMTMTPGCPDCHQASLAEGEGKSPITLTVPEAEFVLEPEEIVYVYAYALTYRGAGPAGAAVDTGQPLRIEGEITYRPWSTPPG